mgnify:CR=1 FL=1
MIRDGSGLWNDAWQLKMGVPFCNTEGHVRHTQASAFGQPRIQERTHTCRAITERAVKLLPSRSRFTLYKIGRDESPGSRKYECMLWMGMSSDNVAWAAMRAWPMTWPPYTPRAPAGVHRDLLAVAKPSVRHRRTTTRSRRTTQTCGTGSCQ